MAALTRAFWPRLFVPLTPTTTRVVKTTINRQTIRHNASKYTILQPTFPENPDEHLFEESTDEYSAFDDALSKESSIAHSRPCDALAAAAAAGDLALGKTLLAEFTTAKINIIHRPEYGKLVILSLKNGDIEASFMFLSMMPTHGMDPAESYQEPIQEMVTTFTKGRLHFKQLVSLLGICARKGWRGPVPLQIIKILAQYQSPTEFLNLFGELTRKYQFDDKKGDTEQLYVEWRAAAIHQLTRRNRPAEGWQLFKQQPAELTRLDEKILVPVHLSARRMGLKIAWEILDAMPPHLHNHVHERRRTPINNTTLSQQAFRFNLAERGSLLPASKQQAISRLSQTLRDLRRILLNRESRIWLDPRAVAYTFNVLCRSKQGERILNLFRKRIARLGDEDTHVFWATTEMELLCLLDDPGSAAQYCLQVFYTPGMPSVFQRPPPGHWHQWLTTTPARTPPLPPYRLRPSATAISAMWKVAITLSLRLPGVTVHGHTVSLPSTTDNQVEHDVSHLKALFEDFLFIYDTGIGRHRTYFSNVYTQVRFFEQFLKRMVVVAPSLCGWVMKEMQRRDVRLDHRVWVIYSRSKVDYGEPEFLLRILELLEADSGAPDFSPSALKDMSNYGSRLGEDNTEKSILLPYKVFNAYVYGFKLLISVGALKEAAELHTRMLRFGYREGTSLPFDRLLHRMLEQMRKAVKLERIGGASDDRPDEDTEGDLVFGANELW